jgi:hypothetical protein
VRHPALEDQGGAQIHLLNRQYGPKLAELGGSGKIVLVKAQLRNGDRGWGEDRLGNRYACVLRAIPNSTIRIAGLSLKVAMEVQPR